MPMSPLPTHTHAGTGDHNDFDFDRIFGIGEYSGSPKKPLNTSVENLFTNRNSGGKLSASKMRTRQSGTPGDTDTATDT